MHGGARTPTQAGGARRGDLYFFNNADDAVIEDGERRPRHRGGEASNYTLPDNHNIELLSMLWLRV